MAYFSRHVDKKTGAVYVYRCESRWDKVLKAPHNRQVYVGKEDPKTHEIIPATPKKAKKDALDGDDPKEGSRGGPHSHSKTDFRLQTPQFPHCKRPKRIIHFHP